MFYHGCMDMWINLPIASVQVYGLGYVLLGGIGGFVSTFLGIGGGIIITPILLMTDIPPMVAVTSQLYNSVGTNLIGFLGYWRDRAVDVPLAWYIFVGGVFGAFAEMLIIHIYDKNSTLDMIYGVILMLLGGTMVAQNIRGALYPKPKHMHVTMREWMIYIPWHRVFVRSRVEISTIIPVGVGFVIGAITITLGGGGNLFIVPILSYLIGRTSPVVAGTSLLAVASISVLVILIQMTNSALGDIVLVGLLLLGSFMGSQLALVVQPWLPRLWPAVLGGITVMLIGFRFFSNPGASIYGVHHGQEWIQIQNGAFNPWCARIHEFASHFPMIYGVGLLLAIMMLAFISERGLRYVVYNWPSLSKWTKK